MKKYILISIIILATFISCKTNKSIVAEVENIPLDAGMLYYYFSNNPDSAVARYSGKKILIDGKIAEFYKDKDGNITVILAQSESINGLECKILPDYIPETPFKKGNKLKIIGNCTEFNKNVIFTDCEILK